MAGTTNFLQTNPSAANQEDDGTYAADSLTTGGVGVDDILPSPWLNKVWFQCTTFICALAYVIANWGGGYTITDTSLATLKAQILAFFQSFVTSGSWSSGNNSDGYWQKDPSGLIRQWGFVTGAVSETAVTFPTPFTNSASISVVATSSIPFGDGIAFVAISNGTVSTTEFEILCGGDESTQNFYWEATGY